MHAVCTANSESHSTTPSASHRAILSVVWQRDREKTIACARSRLGHVDSPAARRAGIARVCSWAAARVIWGVLGGQGVGSKTKANWATSRLCCPHKKSSLNGGLIMTCLPTCQAAPQTPYSAQTVIINLCSGPRFKRSQTV